MQKDKSKKAHYSAGREKINGRSIPVWMNEKEEAELKAKADEADMKLGTFLKKCAFNSTLKITSAADPKLLAAVARIGNNLNQLTRAANRSQDIDPSILVTISEDLRELIS